MRQFLKYCFDAPGAPQGSALGFLVFVLCLARFGDWPSSVFGEERSHSNTTLLIIDPSPFKYSSFHNHAGVQKLNHYLAVVPQASQELGEKEKKLHNVADVPGVTRPAGPGRAFPSAETPQDHWNPLEHWHILYKMDKGRALGTTGVFFPRIFTSPGTEFPHPAVNHKGSDLLLGNGFKKPPLPPAMQEINRFTGGEWDTLFRAFHKFLKLESCYFLIGLRPGKENMVSEQEGRVWDGQLYNSLEVHLVYLGSGGFY